jgi:D-inositol-3-phosphate glycosyltransferase
VDGKAATFDAGQQNSREFYKLTVTASNSEISVALLTGGSDRPYVHGLTSALSSRGIRLDLIGSDELDEPDLRNKPGVSFFKLRGDQRPDASFTEKFFRISKYYLKLVRYAATAKPKIFHILWNNRFQALDRTALMLYYKFLGKKVVLTAHNVNAGRRDSTDTLFNRITLRIQYQLSDQVFVHTAKMKDELSREFGVQRSRITVIPFGINNSVPNTSLSSSQAKQRLGIADDKRTILFFGRITPYKGLEYLVAAFQQLQRQRDDYRLLIIGRLEPGCEKYWDSIQEAIQEDVRMGRIFLRVEFIPDHETEIYFKGADVLVLPYKEIFQSGVLFLGYGFGLPVLVADVGSLKDEIVEGKTGFIFNPEDPADLARTIDRYFASDLFASLNHGRQEIRDLAAERHSWDVVGQRTIGVYANVLRLPSPSELPNRQ